MFVQGSGSTRKKLLLSSLLSSIWLFATPWTAACQTCLSFTVTCSLLTVMSTELVMPSNHPLSPPLGEPLLFSFSLGLGFITALSNSMKLWAMPCRATQDTSVLVESSEKRGLLEKGMANHFSTLALRAPWTGWKGKKIGHWKMNSPGL